MSVNVGDGIDQGAGRLWPVESVMERLGIGRTAVFELIASHQLRSVKLGRRRLVSEAAINEFVNKIDTGGAA